LQEPYFSVAKEAEVLRLLSSLQNFYRSGFSNKFQRAFQKLKEWSVAVSLEKRYTKEEIITLYFNKFDFLFNAKGVEMASRVYFNKSTNQLTLPEAATFVAMLENPRKTTHTETRKGKTRRDVVLEADAGHRLY
jgi:penicillin-binding protein 1A